MDFEADIEVEIDNKINIINFRKKDSSYYITDNEGLSTYQTFKFFTFVIIYVKVSCGWDYENNYKRK